MEKKIIKTRKWVSGHYSNSLMCGSCNFEEIQWNHSFCPNCGKRFNNSVEERALQEVSKWKRKNGDKDV